LTLPIASSGVSRVPAVATYETELAIPRSVEKTFAFVSDFRNASRWDPRTYGVEKVTDGPIGVGTRFVLTGGVVPRHVLERLRVPGSRAGMALPYDVVEFNAPTGFVLEGESRAFRYRDHLEFSAHGENTLLRYAAEVEIKGPLRSWDAILQRIFTRIGDDATRALPAVVAREA
jgi:hypothetical protein